MLNFTAVTFGGRQMFYRVVPDEKVLRIDLKNIEEIIFRESEKILLEQFKGELGLISNLTLLKKCISDISVEWYANLSAKGVLPESCKKSELKSVLDSVEKARIERIEFNQNIINILRARTAHIVWTTN